jgi:hypothetical protein
MCGLLQGREGVGSKSQVQAEASGHCTLAAQIALMRLSISGAIRSLTLHGLGQVMLLMCLRKCVLKLARGRAC